MLCDIVAKKCIILNVKIKIKADFHLTGILKKSLWMQFENSSKSKYLMMPCLTASCLVWFECGLKLFSFHSFNIFCCVNNILYF